MSKKIIIDPVTRIEGHLKIEVTVDEVSGVKQVIDAKSSGTMFRGFETILQGRDPLDAPHFTQRICGVCPVSHGMASCLNLEDAFGVTLPDNGRIMRNLVLGANFLQSHILHFYHLAALDYINTSGLLDIAPWAHRYVTSDMVTGDTAESLVGHYVQALEMRRKSHQMGAIFGGRLPCTSTFVPGGCTESPTADNINSFRTLLSEIRAFTDNVFVPDVLAVAGLFPEYYNIGRGCGNLLAYGVFDMDNTDSNKLLNRGRYTEGGYYPINVADINEDVSHSYYTAACDNRNPSDGLTEVEADKTGAYSWLKAPRYLSKVHEVGPLARMWIEGEYRNGISVLDRIAARALETKKVADAMDIWLNELVVGNSSYVHQGIPVSAVGVGLTEAPRGALGHWIGVTNKLISLYQIVTPTGWNASPVDGLGQNGAIEQALIGTPVGDEEQPIEILRVIHSFDPCLACSVHMLRPGKKYETIVEVRPSI